MTYGFLILTYEPKNDILDFIKQINETGKVEAYVVVDNNNYVPPKEMKKWVLQMDDEKCFKNGFNNVNFVIDKKITSWDKVLFMLCRGLRHLDFSWIVEDDVFVPSVQSVLEMTEKYKEYDLVTANDEGNPKELRNYWHWKHMPRYMDNRSLTSSVDDIYDPSRGWFHSMVCAMGISRNLLYVINLQAMAYKQLMFIEFLFNTLCHQAGLKNTTAPEFENIIWRKAYKDINWNEYDIVARTKAYEAKLNNRATEESLTQTFTGLWFHPVKDRSIHSKIREML
jgi:hypothetical protein